METRNYTISDIDRMSAADLASFAEGVEAIKGHTVYFIDFGGAFGFSACVCADGRHIYYVNDHELHHRGKSRAELRELYRRELSGKLLRLRSCRPCTATTITPQNLTISATITPCAARIFLRFSSAAGFASSEGVPD